MICGWALKAFPVWGVVQTVEAFDLMRKSRDGYSW